MRVAARSCKFWALCRSASTVSDVSANNSARYSGVIPSTTQATNTMTEAVIREVLDQGRGAESRRDNFPLARFMRRPDIGERKYGPANLVG